MVKSSSPNFLFISSILLLIFFCVPTQPNASVVLAIEAEETVPFQEEKIKVMDNGSQNFWDIDKIRFKQISNIEGIPHPVIHDILQDQQGFIWVGTGDGLARFDGQSVKLYQNDPDDPNSLSSNAIHSIYEAKDGTLWIGTRLGVNVLDKQLNQITHYNNDPTNPNSLSHNGVGHQAFYEDDDGNMWIATWGGGLNRFNRKTAVFTHFRHNPTDTNTLIHNTIRALYPSKNGLWLGTDDGLDYFDFSTEQFIHYQHDDFNPDTITVNQIESLYLTPDETQLWVGTINGLDQLILEEGEAPTIENAIFTHYLESDQSKRNLGAIGILGITADKQGGLWLGLSNGGLSYFKPDQKSFSRFQPILGDNHSLSNNTVIVPFLDRFDGLWVGTAGGWLNYYHPSMHKFTLYQNNPYDSASLSHNAVSGIEIGQNDDIWVATWGGGLNRFDAETNTFTHYLHNRDNPNSLSSNNLFNLIEDRQGDLWIASLNGGLNRYNRKANNFSRFLHDVDNSNTIIQNRTRSVLEDRSAFIWVATLTAGVSRFDPERETFTHFQHDRNDQQTLCNNQTWSIFQDSQDTIWVTTTGCLHKFEPLTETFQRYPYNPDDPSALAADTPIEIFEDSQNRLWLTSNKGLHLFDRDTEQFINYTVEDGLPSNRTFSIVEDDNGDLWLGTNLGISRFNPQTKTFHNYDTYDGLQGDLFFYPAAAKGSDGTLYFGGSNGLNVFDPNELPENSIPPPIILSDFQLANKSVVPGEESLLIKDISYLDELRLSYRESDIRFEITLLNYAATEKSKIQYILEGFESEWSESDEQKLSLRYTNLKAGEYILHYIGANNDGVWSKEGKLKIIITPPWWETWWFRSFALISFIGLISVLYFWRIHSIEAAKKHLEAVVAERTTELVEQQKLISANEERHHLARNLHDSMSQSLHSLALTAKTSKYLLEKEKYEALSDSLDLLSDSARQSYSEMRLILYELRVTPDEQTDLLDVLRVRLDKIQQNADIITQYEVDGLEQISKKYEIQIFYILSELINNALKHGAASQINVSIKNNNDMITLRIEDDGQGFTEQYTGDLTQSQANHVGMGLPNIIERVKELNGSVKLKTAPKNGTAISIYIPN